MTTKDTKTTSTQEHERLGAINVLIILAFIGAFVAIVAVAINPGKREVELRNAERESEIKTIIGAIFYYNDEHDGNLPSSIPLEKTCGDPGPEICSTSNAEASCAGLVNLRTLKPDNLVDIPEDPHDTLTNNSTGYFISMNEDRRVTVCAPKAEKGKKVKVEWEIKELENEESKE